MKVDELTAQAIRRAAERVKNDPLMQFLKRLPGAERLAYSVPDKRPKPRGTSPAKKRR